MWFDEKNRASKSIYAQFLLQPVLKIRIWEFVKPLKSSLLIYDFILFKYVIRIFSESELCASGMCQVYVCPKSNSYQAVIRQSIWNLRFRIRYLNQSGEQYLTYLCIYALKFSGWGGRWFWGRRWGKWKWSWRRKSSYTKEYQGRWRLGHGSRNGSTFRTAIQRW